MLDINFIRENQKLVEKSAQAKGYDVNIKELLDLDEKRRDLLKGIENLRQDQNKISQSVQGKPGKSDIERSKAIKKQLDILEKKLKEVLPKYNELLMLVPNVASKDTPIGKDESGNVVRKTVGKVAKSKAEVPNHQDIAQKLNLMDNERAVKIGGNRAYILKNQLVILEQAIIRYALDMVQKEGFEIMNVPVMVREEALIGSGFFPFGEEDIYKLEKDLYLVGTSEASLVYYHADETLAETELPKLLSGVTPCFRREVGAYGKDTKGIFRVHQFNKVEQVVLTKPEEAEKMFNFILGIAEKIVSSLGLPYRLIQICTGDMGAKNAKQYDIEVWFPSQKKYRETHSCSWLTDYQARRANIKYRDNDGNKFFVHTLNCTAVATTRLLAAILENNLQKDGSVKVPDVLVKYTGFKVIK